MRLGLLCMCGSEVNQTKRYDAKGEFKMLRLKNCFMELELVATIGNNALFKRLNDNSFIVAKNVHFKENNTCDWGSGHYYNSYDDAYRYYIKEFVKPFMEYEELFIK